MSYGGQIRRYTNYDGQTHGNINKKQKSQRTPHNELHNFQHSLEGSSCETNLRNSNK